MLVNRHQDGGRIYDEFRQRYQNEIERLQSAGHVCKDIRFNDKREHLIKVEWEHFLNGTYGLCTTTGMPENIAAKELAISEINELVMQESLCEEQLRKLKNAVDLLDNVSSQFAPHERTNSSRNRLIVEVRKKFNLT